MSKFNKAKKPMPKPMPDTVNHEGAPAHMLDAHVDLYVRAASCLVGEPKFYETAGEADEALLRSVRAAAAVDPEYVLQLAVYCREVLHLRSVPLLLLTEYANVAGGRVPGARKYVSRTLGRADELAEIVACQLARNEKHPRQSKLPMMIKHGVREAFEKFDEYEFSKYDRPGTVRLRDAMFLAHPRPGDEARRQLYKKIADRSLPAPMTWEVMRSTGQMTWSQVVREVFHKDGRTHNYMALLRNLRNIMQDKSVTQTDMGLVCTMLADERAVQRSRQLPFRFLTAYREVEQIHSPHAGAVLDALETAAEQSLANLPRLPGNTLIAVDTSGSMDATISQRSTVRRYEIGLILGALAHKFCDKPLTGVFADKYVNVSLAKYSAGVLANASKMRDMIGQAGYGTNGSMIIQYLNQHDLDVDRIMVFTDCQMWDPDRRDPYYRLSGGAENRFAELFLNYQQRHPGTRLYCFDLAGYGTVMLPPTARGVCLIGGWSDRAFDFVAAYDESNKYNVINTIKAIRP